MLCFSTPHFQTRCGLAVLNLRKGYGPPFAKNRTSFTTSDASDAENRRPAALPYAGCAPYSTGTEKQLSPSRSPQNRPRPRFAPRRPVLAGFLPRRGNAASAWTGAGLGHTGASLAEVIGEAEKPFFIFCFSQAGNKTHRSLKPTHSSLLGRASRAPARRCRSAQKAGRSPYPLCTHFAERKKAYETEKKTALSPCASQKSSSAASRSRRTRP